MPKLSMNYESHCELLYFEFLMNLEGKGKDDEDSGGGEENLKYDITKKIRIYIEGT